MRLNCTVSLVDNFLMTTFPSFVFSGPNSDTIGLYWDLFVAFVAAGVSFAFKLKIYRYLIATIHRDHRFLNSRCSSRISLLWGVSTVFEIALEQFFIFLWPLTPTDHPIRLLSQATEVTRHSFLSISATCEVPTCSCLGTWRYKCPRHLNLLRGRKKLLLNSVHAWLLKSCWLLPPWTVEY